MGAAAEAPAVALLRHLLALQRHLRALLLRQLLTLQRHLRGSAACLPALPLEWRGEAPLTLPPPPQQASWDR